MSIESGHIGLSRDDSRRLLHLIAEEGSRPLSPEWDEVTADDSLVSQPEVAAASVLQRLQELPDPQAALQFLAWIGIRRIYEGREPSDD